MLSILYFIFVSLILVTSYKIKKDNNLILEVTCGIISLAFLFLDSYQNSNFNIFKFYFLISSKSFFVLPILAYLSNNFRRYTDVAAIIALTFLTIANSAFTIIFIINLYFVSYVMLKGFNRCIGLGVILSSIYAISGNLSFINNSLGFFSLILFTLLFFVYEVRQDKLMYFVILFYFKVLQFNDIGSVEALKWLIVGFCAHAFLEYYLKIRERGFLGVTFLGFLLLTNPLKISFEAFYLVLFLLNSKESSITNILKVIVLTLLMFISGSESFIYQATLLVFFLSLGFKVDTLKSSYRLEKNDVLYFSSLLLLLFRLKENYQYFNVYGLITFFLFISMLIIMHFKSKEIGLINLSISKNIQPIKHILEKKYRFDFPIMQSTIVKEKHLITSVRIIIKNLDLSESVMAIVIVGVIGFLISLFLLL